MKQRKDRKPKVKPPCDQCPYKLGEIQTLMNPCPLCKENHYRSYEYFIKLRYAGMVENENRVTKEEDV